MRLNLLLYLRCPLQKCDCDDLEVVVDPAEGSVTTTEVEYSEVRTMDVLRKMDYSHIRALAQALGTELPDICPETPDQELLLRLHNCFFEKDIVTGRIQCPKCGVSVPIRGSIPIFKEQACHE